MDLNKLFEMQKPLREKIIKEHNLRGQNLLPGLILALQVELGELANVQRSWKHWSKDRKPRTKALRAPAMMEEDKEYYNPLLDEFADGLSFILEIGLELEISEINISLIRQDNLIDQFNGLFNVISTLAAGFQKNYDYVVSAYLGLGAMLGFDWEQIEQAYIDKNAINHQRQKYGY